MRQKILTKIGTYAAVGAIFLTGAMATAEPKHGIAMYGEPALAPDFVSLPYANPDAPKGGSLSWGESSGFDSLHPFIQKGRAPWVQRFLM